MPRSQEFRLEHLPPLKSSRLPVNILQRRYLVPSSTLGESDHFYISVNRSYDNVLLPINLHAPISSAPPAGVSNGEPV